MTGSRLDRRRMGALPLAAAGILGLIRVRTVGLCIDDSGDEGISMMPPTCISSGF
jgi:hypothetical protein